MLQPSSYDAYNYLDQQVIGITFLFEVDGKALLSVLSYL